MKILLKLLIIILLVGCEKNIVSYEYNTFYKGKLITWKQNFEGVDLKTLENANHYFLNEVNDTLISGKLNNGYNVGLWKYNTGKENVVKIEWKQINSVKSGISLSIPIDWQKKEESEDQLIFDFNYTSKELKQFSIGRTKIGSSKLQDEFELARKEIYEKFSVNDESIFLFETKKSNFYLTCIILLNQKGEQEAYFMLFGEFNEEIIDIVYTSKYEDLERKIIILLELYKSLQIENTRVFPPYNSNTKIISLDS